jgi:putative membrane protein
MNTWRNFSLAAVAAIAAGTLTAQTPQEQKPSTATDPSAASSPHQRGATHSEQSTESSAKTGTKPSDASSPHQHEATKMSAGAETPATFVKKASMAGMTEVELAKLALDKSQDANVRGFAQRMVSDHGKANTELTAIAGRKNLEVSKSLDSEHKKKVQELSGKSGAEFDAAYAQHMTMDHDKAAALFEGASKGSDAELASFAQKTLPTIKEHQKLAKDLKAQTRSAAASDSSSR